METPSSTADLTNNVRNMNVGTVHDTRSTAMDVIEESPRNNVFKRASLPPVETAQSDLNGKISSYYWKAINKIVFFVL
jgi:hypothetical protein